MQIFRKDASMKFMEARNVPLFKSYKSVMSVLKKICTKQYTDNEHHEKCCRISI